MIAKIAVSAATYAIDKPYSYKIPEGMTLQPGQRVQLPFGRANKRTEGVVLTVETGNEEKLKAVERCLDEAPILSEHQLRLAAFLRERYFCTFYECLRVMLPAGLWFQARERISLTGDRSWKEKTIRKDGAAEVLALLESLGGAAEESALRTLIPDEETLSGVIAYLARKKWISAETEYLRRTNDRTEKIAALAVSAEEAMEYASHRPKSAAMQKNVLELMCGVGSVSVKELCYFTGASTATVNRLEKLGYLTACPSNLGTGLRASVMMFLPGLSKDGVIREILPNLRKNGLTVRGFFGEGSGAEGYSYQVSNERTLGLSEEDVLSHMEEVALSLTELEIRHRERMKKEGGAKLKDRCLRAYGTLLNCAVLPWEEYSEKILDVRLGIALDYFETTDSVSLVNFLYNMRPLSFRRGNRVTGGEEECNIRRAEIVGKVLPELVVRAL